MTDRGRSVAWTLCAVWLLLCLYACNSKAVSEQVGDFAQSATAANTAIATYYRGLNEQEMDLYFQLLELDPGKRVGDYIDVADGTGQRIESPLKRQSFDARAIDERVKVLSHLTAYSRGLAELAGAESPSTFQANVSTLKGKFEDLQRHFTNQRNPRAMQYAGALEGLVGVVGKWYLDSKRWQAVRAAVVDAETPVDSLLDFVAEDLRTVQTLNETSADEKYTTAVVYYNLRREKASDAARMAALDQIRRYKQSWDAARASRPDAVVQRLKRAHAALVRVAKEDRTPVSLAALKSELALYKDDVQTLVTSAGIITGLKK